MYKQYNKQIVAYGLQRARHLLPTLKGLKIKTVSKDTKLMGRYYKDTITINPYNHNTLAEYVDTLLHEVAHHLAHYIDPNTRQHHGKLWRHCANYIGAVPRATALCDYKYTIPRGLNLKGQPNANK